HRAPLLLILSFLFSSSRDHPHPHSFPTRRSSDLHFTLPPPLQLHRQLPQPAPLRLVHRIPHRFIHPLAHAVGHLDAVHLHLLDRDRKSTRLNSSHVKISYAVFCLKKKKKDHAPLG